MLAKRALDQVFAQMSNGAFEVRYQDGASDRYGVGEPQFTLRFNSDDFLSLIGEDPLMGFGEAYMDGRVDVDGDLADLLSVAHKSGMMSVASQPVGFSVKALRAAGSMRFLHTEKKNIARHYDLGNEFFRLWLDDSLTYSCAYFRHASDTLEQAQRQKVDHSLNKLRLQPNETLLDIGCGWGALAIRAAQRDHAIFTGIALSEEQCVGANAAIKAQGLQDRASVRLANYSALPAEGKQFDKIVSIGMLEHVGQDNLAGFVQTIEKLLKPGGLAMLHLITSVKEAPINHWIEKYIFPGGYIPTLPEIITHLAVRDFRICDVENLAPHYRMTLDHWSERFERATPSVLEKFDAQFVRMWRLYLRASSAAFREGAIELHQILVSRGPAVDLPLTRDDIYQEKGQC